MKGIDISSWQDGLDLRSASVSFAILKISEGQSWRDKCFDAFYNAASCPVGAYVYSRAMTVGEASAEAIHALSLLNGRYLPLGVYIDVEEERQLALPNLAQIVAAFCDTIREGGYLAGAYGSAGRLWARVDPATFDGIVWAASWGARPSFACDIWQYSAGEHLPGFNGPVDGDEAMSDRFKALINGGEPVIKKPIFTLDRIPVLQKGDTGDEVKALQGELIAWGYPCGGKKNWRGAETPDGVFGNVTEESLRSFQRKRGLPDNGVAEKITRAALLGVKEARE